jgi:hypothetical protein
MPEGHISHPFVLAGISLDLTVVSPREVLDTGLRVRRLPGSFCPLTSLSHNSTCTTVMQQCPCLLPFVFQTQGRWCLPELTICTLFYGSLFAPSMWVQPIPSHKFPLFETTSDLDRYTVLAVQRVLILQPLKFCMLQLSCDLCGLLLMSF